MGKERGSSGQIRPHLGKGSEKGERRMSCAPRPLFPGGGGAWGPRKPREESDSFGQAREPLREPLSALSQRPCDPAIPLLGIHTQETRPERDMCTQCSSQHCLS